MTYYLFDILGRFSGESKTETERSTSVKPNELNADYNWNGLDWVFAPKVKERPTSTVTSQVATSQSTQSLLTHLEFLNLCQTQGGMTDEMLLAAKADSSLSVFWIKFELATGISKDDPDTIAGLTALKSLGYLPNGAIAVIENWPK